MKTNKEESVNIKFEIKDKKLFEVLKSVAYHGKNDSYDAISAYKWIYSHFQSKQQEKIERVEKLKVKYGRQGTNAISDVLSILKKNETSI